MTATTPPEPIVDLLATYFVGGATGAELSDAAVRAMEDGFDSLALRMLAGLTGETSPWEVESLIQRMLRELGLSMPDHSSMVRMMARPMARAFLKGHIAPGDFADHLYALSQKDVHAGHHPWCLLQDEWMLASDGTASTLAEATAALREEAERLAGLYH
ncbi:hypothetical protein JY651_40080 [Pyxidicoccus parkwayensis]|uniref:Uncharacterized protein n=1 Tax=Pyxidicoccus parkwayensis TaxID=2813578 RepID=A0ABX7NSJ3_9BACT|nr:hypothetical protein [Pyxidicoccus parkwaysis]QSQ21324.1 hypothetical protein JY651_40080 [Pyxidicoccus parkwaysis]